ncbi:alpha/beta hydrolase-fold protein [Clostridium sp. D33t1_170424_F3]|uniref:alpha/beta hydrolase n=1 Tax=Clostridium sp. D33t1_170424_F3 TaxID=2787099 RepID=UPI0018AA62DE|nr:alpha/beta hydrolase-fold protein [Clostridium sp. D33t1_170424_F3]
MHASKVETLSFYSQRLKKDMRAMVYLPRDYDELPPLPVLYFLHGRSGDETILSVLEMDTLADRMIQNGEIKPLVIVCPRIENSRGMNSAPVFENVVGSDGENRIQIGRYEDYLIEEVIPLIDRTYHVIPDKSGRYIGGVSGGGYAALHNAFRHPELFTRVGGHMPAVELQLEEEDKPFFKNMDIWKAYDPISIAKSPLMPDGLTVYLDAGDQDEGGFYEGCAILQDILRAKGITVQNHIFSGHHNVAYIKANLEKYLKFYSS